MQSCDDCYLIYIDRRRGSNLTLMVILRFTMGLYQQYVLITWDNHVLGGSTAFRGCRQCTATREEFKSVVYKLNKMHHRLYVHAYDISYSVHVCAKHA